jgi:hypothetical protein
MEGFHVHPRPYKTAAVHPKWLPTWLPARALAGADRQTLASAAADTWARNVWLAAQIAVSARLDSLVSRALSIWGRFQDGLDPPQSHIPSALAFADDQRREQLEQPHRVRFTAERHLRSCIGLLECEAPSGSDRSESRFELDLAIGLNSRIPREFPSPSSRRSAHPERGSRPDRSLRRFLHGFDVRIHGRIVFSRSKRNSKTSPTGRSMTTTDSIIAPIGPTSTSVQADTSSYHSPDSDRFAAGQRQVAHPGWFSDPIRPRNKPIDTPLTERAAVQAVGSAAAHTVRVSSQGDLLNRRGPIGRMAPKGRSARTFQRARDTSNPLLPQEISLARPEGLEPPTF